MATTLVASDRFLQDGTSNPTAGVPVGGILTSNFTTLVPTSAPLSPPSDSTPSSTTTGTSTSSSGSSSNHFFTFFILCVMGALIAWILWTRYRRTQEKRRMDYRSAQADRVLGDMQMVPNTDLDLENELL